MLIENIPQLVTKATYTAIREHISTKLERLGYARQGFVITALNCEVSQHRKQGRLVAFRADLIRDFGVLHGRAGLAPG